MKTDKVKISKFMSLVLRHKPEVINLKLDAEGWCDTKALLKGMRNNKFDITLDIMKEVVETNNKQRFAFNKDFSKIRANQGHSVKVDLKLKEQKPPNVLYHGTVWTNIESIKKNGLQKQKRHHVHLSVDKETALSVGKRYGEPVILEIDSGLMYNNGVKFYISENGVYLTDTVEPQYIKI